MKEKQISGRGKHFEQRVERRLKANFPDSEILHDVRIPGRKGNPTQIDFVMLDETGIYVIEAKCYSGVVKGMETDVLWRKTSTDRNGNERSVLSMNPIKQNAQHVKYLKKLIGDESIPVFSISIVSEKCDFRSIDVSTPDTYLFHLKEFTLGIKGIIETADPEVSQAKAEEIKRVLGSCSVNTEEV